MESLRTSADVGAAEDQSDGRDAPVAAVVVSLADVSLTDLGHPPHPRTAHDLSRSTGTPGAPSTDRVWRWTIAVQGTCRRASTTAFDRRRDALFTSTRFIETAKRIVRFEPTRLGATITHAPCEPAQASDVPGQHVLCLELRDTDAATIGRIYERLVSEAWTIGRLSSSTFTFTPHASNPTVLYEVSDATAASAPPRVMMPSRRTQSMMTDAAQSRVG